MFQPLKRFIFSLGGYLAFVFLFIFAARSFQTSGVFFGFDKAVFGFLVSIRQEWLTDLMLLATFLGDIKFILPVTLLSLLLFYLKKEKIFLLALMFSVGVSGFLVFALKEIFLRERPTGVALIKESDFSFPSGHAMMAIAFFGFLAYFLTHYVENRFWKIFLVAVIVVLMLLISVSRIYLGVHWPTDILSSWILGGVWLAMLIWISRLSSTVEQRYRKP